MAKTSFKDMDKKPVTKKAAAKKTTTKKAPSKKAAKKKAEVAKTEDDSEGALVPTEGNRMSGDFSQDDLILPRINIVAKTSELVDEGFTPGAIALSKEVEIAYKDEPIQVIILSMEKKFQEDLPYGSEEQPRLFETKAEMQAEGYSTEYGSELYCQAMANFVLLVEKPEDFEDEVGLFSHHHEGKDYVMAALTAAKTAYKTTAKEVVSAVTFSKAAALHGMRWSLTSKIKTFGDNSWFSPFMKRAGVLSETELEFVESILPQD